MKKAVVWVFLAVIFAPILLGLTGKLVGARFDVELLGYTDSVEKPELSVHTFLDGTFQKDYGAWMEENMPLRGVFTRTYNTIRYEGFSLGNRIVGNHGSIFETAYVEAELALGDYDYSDPARAQRMQNVVDHMASVDQKLRAVGKHLYVYIAPSKANLYPEDIPRNYVAMAQPGGIRAVDLFRERISATDVPYLICADMKDSLEYPAFYPTGIHWSRTYEQLASQRIVNDLSALSGETYQNIEITGVRTSKTPFWRDSDVYNLLNVWLPQDVDYYEYTTQPAEEGPVSELDILLMGDSFGLGLCKDIGNPLADVSIWYIDRSNSLSGPDGKQQLLERNWENLDLQTCLDRVDFVVLEIVESELVYDTHGFIDYLDAYLDHYTPALKSDDYPACLDASRTETWNLELVEGVYDRGNEHYAWTKPAFRVPLHSESISNNGLEIAFAVPRHTVDSGEPQQVEVAVNGTVVCRETYTAPGDVRMILPPDQFQRDENDSYVVTINCSQTFNPYTLGESMDNRDLALALRYIGGAR